MKWIVAVAVILILMFALIPFPSEASGNHHGVTNNMTIIHQSAITVIEQSGVALGLAASQHVCDSGTKKSQVSIGVGSYDGANALSLGACKSINNTTINGSIGQEDGKTGYGLGFSVKF